jgi:hypothetical protein
VNAAYSCQDESGGSGLKSCQGTVANGSAIDTASSGTKTFTVTATDNAGNQNSITRTYSVSSSPNSSPISIPDSGRATPYPATVNMSGLSGTITDVNVTLHGVRHTWPDDLSILLVGPAGQKVILMSDVGGWYWLNGEKLTLDDEAPGKLPDSTQITAGSYIPTRGTISGGSTASPASLPSPAPAGPYGTSLSTFDGADPNGTYSLYVFDDAARDMGQIAAGFSLDIKTTANPG